MDSIYLPTEVDLALKEKFFFPERHLFGAVATIQKSYPCVRTMRIYDINKEGCPVLLTHVASNKWKEFADHPYVSINMVSENKLVQMIVRGMLQLDTPNSAFDKAKRYWNMVRPDVKKIYDPAHTVGDLFCKANVLNIPQEIPDTFGIACVIPEFWELLLLDSEYTNSLRYQFHLANSKWQKQRVHVG